MNLNKLTKLSELFSFAISVDEIKRKPKGQISTQEEFENIINQLSSVENNPDNKLTIQFAIEISKGKETLNSAIEKIKKLTEKKSVSLQDQLKQKYKSDIVEIEKTLNNHGKKYLTIACKWILEDKNNLIDVCQTLNIFDSVSNYLSHSNPDKYNSYEDLHLEISAVPDKEIVDLNVDLPFLGSAGSYKIYRIENQSQGMKIGQEIENAIGWDKIQKKVGGAGRWCITWTKNNYYNTYSSLNQYFYFVDDTSQDWNKGFNKLKSCVVHYTKDFEGNIIEKNVTTLANGSPEDISSYSKLSAVDNIITKDVEKQPERVLSKLKRGAADQKEFNTFVVNYHMNPNPEVIEQEKKGLKSFLNQVDDKYFNKSLYNIVKSCKTEEYKLISIELIFRTQDYELLNNLPKDVQIEVIKKDWHIIKNIENPSETIQLAAINQYVFAIAHIKNPSEQVQLIAIDKDIRVLQHITNPSEQVQLIAIEKDIRALQYITNPSEAVLIAAVKQKENAFRDYIYHRNPSEAVQLVAVQQNGLNIKSIKNPSEAVQLVAVQQNGLNIKHINNPSEAVQLAALKQNIEAIDFIKKPSEKVLSLYHREFAQKELKDLEKVKQNAWSIYEIDDVVNPSKAVILEAVKQNWLIIQGIKNPSEAVQLAALEQDIKAVDYITNPSEKVLSLYHREFAQKELRDLEKVKQNGWEIGHIKNPSEAVQLEVLKQNPELFYSINSPTPLVQTTYYNWRRDNPSEDDGADEGYQNWIEGNQGSGGEDDGEFDRLDRHYDPYDPYVNAEIIINPGIIKIYGQSLKTEKMAKAYLKVFKFGF